jgi:hypothetical protein
MSFTTPVQYTTTFKASELTTRKLENGNKKVYCPTFSGSEGLEVLFHVIHYFERIAVEDLNLFLPDQQGIDYSLMFKLFKHILNDSALLFWETLVAQSYPTQGSHNETNWKLALKELKRAFAGGIKARDNILRYLSSNACKKKPDTAVDSHVRRISQLISYANESEGLKSETTTFEHNDIIFQTLPQVWRHAFESSGRDLSTVTIQEMIDFFSLQKEYFDRMNQLKQRRFKKRSRGNIQQSQQSFKPTRSTFINEAKRKPSGMDKCPVHLMSTHRWIDCYINPESPNYRAKRPKPTNQSSKNPNASQFSSQFKNNKKRPNDTSEQHYESGSEDDNSSDGPPINYSDSMDDSAELHVYEKTSARSSTMKSPEMERATSNVETGTWWTRPDQPCHGKSHGT